jgi:hypothetical protein
MIEAWSVPCCAEGLVVAAEGHVCAESALVHDDAVQPRLRLAFSI